MEDEPTQTSPNEDQPQISEDNVSKEYTVPENPSEKQKDLNWCAERALVYYDQGDNKGAIRSVMSDLSKVGVDISNPLTLIVVQEGANKSREDFVAAITGFHLSDSLAPTEVE